MRPIKILHIVSDSAPGGVPSLVYLLNKQLDRTRFECAVACRTNGPFYSQIQQLGLPVFPLKMESRFDWAAFQALRHICREWQPDLVHTHANRAGLAGRLAAFLSTRPPIVHSTHGLHLTPYHSHRRVLALRLVEQVLGLTTTRLLACSPSEAALIRHLKIVPSFKLAVIENGVELELFHRADESTKRKFKARLGFEPDYPLIGTIGRLTYQKAPEIFIEMAQELSKTCPSAQFIMVGGGPMQAELEQLAAAKGLGPHFRLCPPVDPAEIPDLLAALDVFVLTSRWEGFPFVVIEAMAAGVPVVATAAMGTVDQITPGRTGLLAPVNAASELAGQVLTLLNNCDLAQSLAQAAYEQVQTNYSIQTITARYEAFYLDLVKKYGG